MTATTTCAAKLIETIRDEASPAVEPAAAYGMLDGLFQQALLSHHQQVPLERGAEAQGREHLAGGRR